MKPVQDKPSRNEGEFFAKHDAELIKELRDRLDAERARQERSSHFMKCPRCGADLAEKRFGHAVVDVCPDCRGIWFDAGEADMIRRTLGADSEKSARSFFDDLRDIFHVGGER